MRPRSRPVRSHLAVLVAALALGAAIGPAAGASLSLTSQALTVYRTCTITATPSTTSVVTDTYVQQNKGTTNNGTTTTLVVSSSGTSNQRAYVRFDLTQCNPAIPSTATVRLATIRLYASAVPSSVCRTIDVFDVSAAWTETGLTWNTQPSGTAINTPASATATDTFTAGSLAGCQNTAAGYLTGITVTPDVAAWVAGSATNNGWLLRDDVEGSATARTLTMTSKNANILAQAPQLVVTYVAVP